MAAAFMRPYKSSDFATTSHICRATLPPGLAASGPAVRIAPYIWTHQYTLLSPATCFVLDDGSGAAVGYVIGCADVFALAAAYPRYVDEVLLGEGSADVTVPGQLTRLEPWLVPGSGKEELVRGFRGTMHIDLLEGWRGKGWGREMIEVFMESVRDAVKEGEGGMDCGKGVHIGVAGENKKVVPFYERVGLRVYEGAEREDGNVWMVYEIA
ncbi:hypothetical protein diail_9698 [Diaporthe ilicicola]|nr:hypothetical protein diail_9698 [Diaporthe ilicicola]